MKRRWIASNANVPFKPNSLNKVAEDWIPMKRVPSTLNSNVLWIGGVNAWGCVNVNSIPVYVKGGT